MADEFPDPDDEYDIIHEEEYETLREIEENSCRKQLNFSQSGESKVSKQPSQVAQAAQLSSSRSQATNTGKENVGVAPSGGTTKRTIEDLFGEIGDLLGDDDFQETSSDQPKAKKLRWDQEDVLIDKILACRKQEVDKWRSDNVDSVPENEERKRDSISTRVPTWNFVAVTRCSDSQRFYVRVKRDEKYALVKSRPASTLLSVSFSKLKAEAEEILVNTALKLSEESKECRSIPAAFGDELWVDKYHPRKYTELLSEETVNRTLLHWLKLWDKIVFNRDPVKRRVSKIAPKFGEKKYINKNIEGLDEKGFPVPRVVLLSGPPGLGKTTLAHLAANHAGYNVIEMNASSDRGTKEFKAALCSSTQMKAVMGKNPRPNCLVMDEIDGAPAASIDILIKFIQGKLEEDSDPSLKKKRKAKKESVGCRRPVLCICNDAYAPSLRALRPMALVIPVSGVSSVRLSSRLMEILRRQGLDADPSMLAALAEQSGCDIRACLGALQYMGGVKAGQRLTIAPKDVRRGIFDCWREIFQIPRDRSGPLDGKERAGRILQVAYGGETDLLVRGVFHNYLEVIFRNDGMETVAGALDWFQLYDELNQAVMSQQAWNLMPYTNYAFVAWHFNFAVMQNPKLGYPTVENEILQKSARVNAILALTRQVSRIDRIALIYDVAPLLTDLLTPSLRSVSYHLYSAMEKADLARLVDVLLHLGLNLVQDRTPEGGYVYNLEPNLEEVGRFPDSRQRRSLTYAVKQIVVRELEVARLKKFEVTNIAKPRSDVGPGNSIGAYKKSEKFSAPSNPAIPNHLVRLQPVAAQTVQKETHQYRDFFGRVIVKSPQNRDSGVDKGKKNSNDISPGSKQALSRSDVWFKYKEGYSNAVRRKVRIHDLE